MKYTSILAGALGLMALAACNDEVKIEQPKVAKAPTLTVTLGNGANTRLTFSSWNATDGIKGQWEIGDEIYVAEEGSNTPSYFYKSEGEGPTAVFTIEDYEGVPPSNNVDYYVGFPKTFCAEGFDLSSQDGDFKALENYAYASGTVKFHDSKVSSEVTLKPLSTILVIPAGTVIPHLYSSNFDPRDVTLTITGDKTNLIPKWKPGEDEVEGSITMVADDMFVVEDGEVKAVSHTYIVIPVFGDPVTNLEFVFNSGSTVTVYRLTIAGLDGGIDFVTIPDGGSVYSVAGHLSIDQDIS